MLPIRPIRFLPVALVVLLSIGCSTQVDEYSAISDVSQSVNEGQQYVMATHSFSVFVGPSGFKSLTEPQPGIDQGPLGALAAERGKEGHKALAIQMIGGSTPMQHWQQGDGDDSKNIAKVALRKGGVDVFTLSPNRTMPEPAIDLFGDLVIETNPNARILTQYSWAAFDGQGSTLISERGTQKITFENTSRDATTIETIDQWITEAEDEGGYLIRLRDQLAGIDQRAGREITFIVPSANAIYNFRKQIALGNVPGIEKQSEIFRDNLGHVTDPGKHLVAYVWYSVMYRESPVGMTALIDSTDPTSTAREALLQKIAWNVVVKEPKSGVKGMPVSL